MVMKNIFLIIIFSVLSTFSTQQIHVVKIGAIFFTDETNLENAFDEAIAKINKLESVVSLVASKHYVNSDDSFILQQLACDLIANGVAAMFGPSSKAKSDIVEILCNSTGIPHLQFDWHAVKRGPERRSYQMTVNVTPTDVLLGAGIFDILRSAFFRWKTFSIVYESDARLSRLQSILSWKQVHKNGIKMFKFSRGDDYFVLWKTINTMREKFVVLDCPPDILKDVVNALSFFKMNGPFNNFLLIDLDTHMGDLGDLYSEEFTAVFSAIRIRSYIPPTAHEELDVFEDQEEDKIVAIRSQLIYDSVILYFNALLRIVKRFQYEQPQLESNSCGLTYWDTGIKIVEEMRVVSWKNVTPHFKTQKLSINQLGERDDFNLEIYNPFTKHLKYVWNKQHLLVEFSKLAENATKKAQARVEEEKEDYSQTRVVYIVATKIGEPYVTWRPEPEGVHYEGNERFEGYAVDLIYNLSKECNFGFEFKIVPDNKYGSYDPITGEWDGIIRELVDHKAHIGICDLTITHARQQVVDFTGPFMPLGISILYYKTPPPPKKLFAFLDPFALEVWLYLLIAILIIALVLVVLARISRPEWQYTGEIVDDGNVLENIWHLRNAMWLIIGSILNAGCDILPRGGPMRVLTAFWWIFAMLMSQTYIAKLASFITSQKMGGSITNLHDLVQQNKVQFGTVKGGSTSAFFSESNESDYRIGWNKMINMKPDAFTKDNAEGVERVKRSKGGYAFLMETTNLQYFLQRNCELTQIGPQFGQKHYGIALPQNAPYRTDLNVGILKLSEKGILATLKNKWFNTEKKCDSGGGSIGENSSQFNMETVGGLFLVLLVGIFVAFIIVIGELLWHVERVAAKQKLKFMLVLKAEVMFFVRFWLTRKPIHIYKKKPKPVDGCSIEASSSTLSVTESAGKVKKKRKSRNSRETT